MEVILAKTAGFCFGVSRAAEYAFTEAQDKKLCSLGPLTHNSFVLEKLEQHGVETISDISQANGRTLLIRTHGVAKAVYDELNQKNISYADLTCPYVKKIHHIALAQTALGDTLIIAGDKKHPEMLGITGWVTGGYITVNTAQEAAAHNFDKTLSYSIVAQTTFVSEVFDEIVSVLKSAGLNIKIFDTICSATKQRLSEAAEISKNVDIMLVLGDEKSSNAVKLYEICKEICKKTYFFESINDLVLKNISGCVKIGLTAGASTPPEIIKEAIRAMNDADKNTQSFEELLDENLVSLRTGDVVKGTVIQVTNNEISVNLQYKSDGIIPKSEYTDDNNADLTDLVKPGEEIEVYVSRVNDGDGNVLLSKKRLDSQKGWSVIEEAFNAGTPIKGKFADVIKGGMMANICGLRVFVPSSQVSSRYVEDLKRFKGKEYDFKIIEFDRKSRRIVAGRKEYAIKEEKELREKVFETIAVGQRITGTVSRVVDFGAFVDLGGVDGLIHISQMSWGRVKKAGDVVKEGNDVTVTVLDIDKEHSKISLSLKDVNNDPWLSVVEKYAIGDVVEGKVVRMASFGAFVELEDGVDGLVHVSQISDRHVPKPDDALVIGDIIKVKVTEVDPESKRISLSKKEADALDPNYVPPADDEEEAETTAETEEIIDPAPEEAEEVPVAEEAEEIEETPVAEEAEEIEVVSVADVPAAKAAEAEEEAEAIEAALDGLETLNALYQVDDPEETADTKVDE